VHVLNVLKVIVWFVLEIHVKLAEMDLF